MNPKPLEGFRILVTREEQQAEGLVKKIIERGGEPILIPLLDFVLPENTAPILQTIDVLHKYDWLIFTSKNGVDHFFALFKKSTQTKNIPKIAVIGEKTYGAVIEQGFTPVFMPSSFVAEDFAEQFSEMLTEGTKVLLAKGNLARSVISSSINRHGAVCDEVIVYKTVMPQSSEGRLVEALLTKKPDIITFTSSSTVNHLMETVNKYNIKGCLSESLIVCIGPIAKDTAEHHGLHVHVCPETYTTNAMLDSLINYIQSDMGGI